MQKSEFHQLCFRGYFQHCMPEYGSHRRTAQLFFFLRGAPAWAPECRPWADAMADATRRPAPTSAAAPPRANIRSRDMDVGSRGCTSPRYNLYRQGRHAHRRCVSLEGCAEVPWERRCRGCAHGRPQTEARGAGVAKARCTPILCSAEWSARSVQLPVAPDLHTFSSTSDTTREVHISGKRVVNRSQKKSAAVLTQAADLHVLRTARATVL